jgi:hypothetical protein
MPAELVVLGKGLVRFCCIIQVNRPSTVVRSGKAVKFHTVASEMPA